MSTVSKSIKSKLKIGNIVGVTWLDSGAAYVRTHTPAEDCTLFRFISFGQVMSIDNERVIIGYTLNRDKTDYSVDEYFVIALCCIEKIRVYK